LSAALSQIDAACGLRVLLELPDADKPAERAAARSIELFPVGPTYHDGRPARDGVVVGYAALPEHEFAPGLTALVGILAD
jgi:DNA-binding transcriptional MocR family regulator